MRVAGEITALALLLAAERPGAAPAEAKGVATLAWLQGCWQATSGDGVVEEQWTAPRGRSMVGLSRTVRGGELTEYEMVVVRERGDRLVYIAHPSGQPAAEFLSTDVSEAAVVFENLQHDFPQRIGYQRKGSELLAWIEGKRDGRTRRVEFPYRRVACAGD